MNPRNFGSRKSGELLQIAGLPGATHAFVPNPFPPQWSWPARLWPILLEARTALASLDGTGKHLPNPELVLRPLQNREAQRSSSLEGTFTDPQGQLLFEMEPRYPTSTDDPANAYREVFNYAQALRLRLETKKDLPLSLRLIRNLHRTLMDGVRGAEQNPGEFRRFQNQIGRPPRYVPPPSNLVPGLLDNFEKYLHQDFPFDPLVNAFLVHYQFEAIHPFADGNGRVGRLLLAILTAEWCGLSNQWLYMSAFFDQHKDEYIDRLFSISTESAWEEWIEFCLKGTVSQARDTEKRCERLLKLNQKFHSKIQELGGSYRLQAIVDELFQAPVVRVTALANRFKVTYPTASADILKLVTAKILRPLEHIRPKAYYCPKILEITYEEVP